MSEPERLGRYYLHNTAGGKSWETPCPCETCRCPEHPACADKECPCCGRIAVLYATGWDAAGNPIGIVSRPEEPE